MKKFLWEILVPTEKRLPTTKNKYYTTKYHKNWDAKVRKISGGLTILTPTKGQWISDTGELYSERMIPVRFIATKSDAEKIVDFTITYYDQLAVLCYKISNCIILKSRND
jgi:hypothetical protein